jgi:DNA-binding CsgD family transcriptional regulator
MLMTILKTLNNLARDRLTRVQLKTKLAEGRRSQRDFAEALGIAETTVRSHLNQTYHKTGVNRQADLVKLVAAFSNPLLN